MSQSRENLQTDGRTDRRMERPYFIGPFWPRMQVQKLVDKLVKECSENIENEMISVTLQYYRSACNCCIIYIVLFVIAFQLIISISSSFFYFHWCSINVVKGALSGLRQFLATESPLNMMKNNFYFTSKGLFFLKIFKFLS